MKKILTFFLVIALFLACNKDRKKQYSYWKINGVEYSTNDVELSVG